MMLLPILETAGVILSIDFVSGMIHWAEDTFWTEETPVLGTWVVKPNLLHHRDGSAFIRNSWLRSSWDLLLASLVILCAAALLNRLTWQVWLFAILAANANQIHKWAHLPPTKASWPIGILQRLHLLQSRSHHAGHHRGGKNTRYCVITEVLNPVLDRVGFWRALERAVIRFWGVPSRLQG